MNKPSFSFARTTVFLLASPRVKGRMIRKEAKSAFSRQCLSYSKKFVVFPIKGGEEKMASRRLMSLIFAICVSTTASATTGANFEDLTLAPESYWNGSDEAGGFNSGSAWFSNNYNADYNSWDGFAYSNITDTTTAGTAGQYNAITGEGQNSSANYVISYVGWAESPTITLDTACAVDGLYVTNNNYAYYSMLDGDAYAKKFGGEDGDDEDWFMLTITGKDIYGDVTGIVDFYLADYRFENNSLDYIVNTWEYVDLSSLGVVKSLEFGLSSSDVGDWGMNTPAYFSMDTIIPEPSTMVLLALGGLLIRKRKV
jgi:hypothetical protein